VTCGSGYDCWLDGNANNVCARSCNGSTCGSGACCDVNQTCHNAILSCGGGGACMPCE
jgi:hypothetical protein